jgi:hypothetical protein
MNFAVQYIVKLNEWDDRVPVHDWEGQDEQVPVYTIAICGSLRDAVEVSFALEDTGRTCRVKERLGVGRKRKIHYPPYEGANKDF